MAESGEASPLIAYGHTEAHVPHVPRRGALAVRVAYAAATCGVVAGACVALSSPADSPGNGGSSDVTKLASNAAARASSNSPTIAFANADYSKGELCILS